ncbi:hypothetical protein MNEG_2504 [Monoraphidium neglectum]|uniref:CCD97-like C-terminal domain-containing protein n=1 Tax=Monoraphidium neglectum TaxID=145388 RepID=A0A0D2MSD6_9CHLO|nr:hypothetical protein MNEG_2504 [Monoraphidium neglectum]KIZ05460.1 hypothetical protein MNEG_2504 [Monoraphidium neglectum]|eukprot:XP_013904479.1 hypothetical protein MNEG_2504 [Monoraphidium neglectum]
MSEEESDDFGPAPVPADAAAPQPVQDNRRCDGANGAAGPGSEAAAGGAAVGSPDAAQAAQRRREFLMDMRGRFLCGEDKDYVDYSEIDADASLDDEEHVRRQQDQDAEDAYFDDVMEGVD